MSFLFRREESGVRASIGLGTSATRITKETDAWSQSTPAVAF